MERISKRFFTGDAHAETGPHEEERKVRIEEVGAGGGEVLVMGTFRPSSFRISVSTRNGSTDLLDCDIREAFVSTTCASNVFISHQQLDEEVKKQLILAVEGVN